MKYRFIVEFLGKNNLCCYITFAKQSVMLLFGVNEVIVVKDILMYLA